MFQTLYIFSDFGVLALRFILGIVMLYHGWPKLKNLKDTSNSFESMGFRPGIFWGPIVAIVEFFGGLALIFGIFVQLVAALLVIQFLVIIVWKTLKKKSFIEKEVDFLILAASALLLVQGSGFLSLDSFLGF